jgi:hypothetical protein
MAITLDSLGDDAKSVVLKKAVTTDASKEALWNSSLESDDCHSS